MEHDPLWYRAGRVILYVVVAVALLFMFFSCAAAIGDASYCTKQEERQRVCTP